jgi:carbonic anhydrase
MCKACGDQGLAHRQALGRRKVLSLGLGLAAAGLVAPLRARADASGAPPPKPQNVISPDEALERLLEGNARFVAGFAKRRDFVAEREALVGGQNPYAAILSCADSRIAPEYAFDSGQGDLFVCRVAGNFLTTDNIASFEYAVDVLKTPFILVLGHEQCGAVKAAIASVVDKVTLPGHLSALAEGLAPAVLETADKPGDRLLNAIRDNVRRNVEALKTTTPIISAAVNEGRVKVAGGLYRLQTGQVELIG